MNSMVPRIAINTILFTGTLAVACVVDFVRTMQTYKKKMQ